MLLVPAAGNSPKTALDLGLPWAADNAAFSGFHPAAFCGLLARIGRSPGCRFVACPDVVGDAAATLDQFRVWAPVLRIVGLPVALVAQDGMERLGVPWDEIDALFVGGSTDWKLGAGVAALVREAKSRGLWVHMGRVNTRFRMRYAHGLGCDSIDGSGFSRWPDQRVPVALRWLAELDGGVQPGRGRDVPELFRGGDPFAARGWEVVSATRFDAGYSVTVRAYAGASTSCPRCGQASHLPPYKHGTRRATVWDAPRGEVPVRLTFLRPRLRCRTCASVYLGRTGGVRADLLLTAAAVEWLKVHGRFTPDSAAKYFGVTPKTVRRWRRRLAGERLK